METGTIKNVVLGRNFGFIERDGKDAFFHLNDIADADLEWDERLVQRRVSFVIVSDTRGPRATAVRAAQ